MNEVPCLAVIKTSGYDSVARVPYPQGTPDIRVLLPVLSRCRDGVIARGCQGTTVFPSVFAPPLGLRCLFSLCCLQNIFIYFWFFQVFVDSCFALSLVHFNQSL